MTLHPSVFATAVLRSGKTLSFWVRGNSMTPALRDGERITVVPLRDSPVRFGEILLYDAPEGPIAHRLIGFSGEEFVLRGDASLATDTVTRERILGRVIVVERNGVEVRIAGLFPRATGLLINRLRGLRSRLRLQ